MWETEAMLFHHRSTLGRNAKTGNHATRSPVFHVPLCEDAEKGGGYSGTRRKRVWQQNWLTLVSQPKFTKPVRRLSMKSITLSEKDIARFWSKVKISNPDECWECVEKVVDENVNGYGRIGIQGKLYLMHRISWIIKNGDLKNELSVCHKCDNRKCVNPNHLFLGTHEENIKDMVLKNRQCRGEKVSRSKLKESDVLQIKTMLNEGLSTRKIAKMFGINCASVSKIQTGRLWSWLNR